MMVLLFFTLITCVMIVAANDLKQGPLHLQLFCDTKAKKDWLNSLGDRLDVDRLPRSSNDPADVIVYPDDIPWLERQLRDKNVEYRLPERNTKKLLSSSHKSRLPCKRGRRKAAVGGINFQSFPRYDEVKTYLKYLEGAYNDLVTYFSLGESTEGREIAGIKISTDNEKNKSAIFIDAGIHAREWIAPITAIYAIKQLVENITNRYLIDNVDVYIVPLLNPDGYEFTHMDKTTRMWRKTRSKLGMPDCSGVDANRNFGIEWNTIGTSYNPCRDTYAGPIPFSEPETRALRDFILEHNNRIKAYVTLHSYGNYILYPWGFTSQVPKHESLLKCVAEKAEAELSKVRGTRYKIGSSTNVLYAASGGSDDWAMGVAGIELVYTMELPSRDYGFSPPISEILPVGEETFEAIKVFMNYVNGDVCANLRPQKIVKNSQGYLFF